MSTTAPTTNDPPTPSPKYGQAGWGPDAPPEPAPATMTAAVARRYVHTPEEAAGVVAIGEVPVPRPRRYEVLVRVAASSLNALDWHFASGTPYMLRTIGGFRRPRHPVRGGDVVGNVVAVGSRVEGLSMGDRVFGECLHGGFAEYTTLRADRAAPVPAGVTDEQAAATPVAGTTALQAVLTHGRVGAGDRVCVNGAAGGVGTFAVQIAVAAGAEVSAVCGPRNVEMVRGLGAAEVLDYTVDDFTTAVGRYDVMLDIVGNREPEACMAVLRKGGRYVAVSGPKDNKWLGPVPDLVRRRIAARRADREFSQFTASTTTEDLRTIGSMVADGSIRPMIDRVVELDGVGAGLAEIGTGHLRAKIVVRPLITSGDQRR